MVIYLIIDRLFIHFFYILRAPRLACMIRIVVMTIRVFSCRKCDDCYNIILSINFFVSYIFH